MAIETIAASALGGLLRLAPEVMGMLDRKNERAHEQIMAEKSGRTEVEVKRLEALQEALKSQGQLTGIKFVDGWNQLMRPIIATQWVVILYPAYLYALWDRLVDLNVDKLEAFAQVFGQDEKAICATIISFFFVGRVFDIIRKRKHGH